MKLLVIGIDGGTRSILEGMPMPFTHSLFKTSSSKTLNEDLISRGWAEALTGEHASTNKGFYLMPLADGSYDFSGSYSKSDMLDASSNEPLWKLVNKAGYSVGFANVPTTGPADDVTGFIIAGGGGGLKASSGVPDGMVSPSKYKTNLQNNNYVFDIRLPGGEDLVSEFISKISKAERIQKDTFLELSKLEKPDFGFHCFRITTEVQYLARYEINMCIKDISDAKEKGEVFIPKNEIQATIINHYVKLDESIKSLFNELDPESYILIGDHSTALFEYEANVDVWLHARGFLSIQSDKKSFARRVIRFAFRKTAAFFAKETQPKASLIRKPITKFSKNETLAFGTFYDTGNFAGIFINDKARFGGPVHSDKVRDDLISEICDEFNADPICIKYGLIAKPYKSYFKGAQFQDIMPDIKIHKPDSIYFSSRQWEFVVSNKNLKPLDLSLANIQYPHAGTKGSDPLFIYSNNLEPLIQRNDPNDLRLTYNIVSRFFT